MIKNILVILVFLCVLQQQYVQAQRFTYRTTITNANPSTVSSQLSDEYLYLFNPMNLYRYSLSSLPFQIEKGVTFVGAASSNSFDYITPVISPRDTLWFNIDSKYGLMYYNQDGMYEFSNMNSSSILTNAGFVIDAIDSISVFNFLQPYHLCTYSTQNKIVRHNDFHIPTTPTNLVCDFKNFKCYLTTINSFLIYQISHTENPILIENVSTQDSFIRRAGIISLDSCPEKLVYYCVESDQDIFIEGRFNNGSVLFSNLVGSKLAVGNCGYTEIDNIEGQIFVITTLNYAMSCDVFGKNCEKMKLSQLVKNVGMNLIKSSDSSVENHLVFPQNDNTFLFFTYSKICPKGCGGNGVCIEKQCLCKDARHTNSFCDTTPLVSDIKPFVTDDGHLIWNITGDFGLPLIQSDSLIKMKSSGNTFSYSLTSATFSQNVIQYKPLLYVGNSVQLTLEINGHNSIENTFTFLYPPVTISGYRQEKEKVYLVGDNFATCYGYLISSGNHQLQSSSFNRTQRELILPKTIEPNQLINYQISPTLTGSISIKLVPFVESISQPKHDHGDTITISGWFFSTSPKVYINDKLISSTFTDKIQVVLPNGLYSNLKISNGLFNTTVALVYPNPTIEKVEHVSESLIVLTGSNFGFNSTAISISLSNKPLTIQSLNSNQGKININLLNDSNKGTLQLQVDNKSVSKSVNLKPVIVSITPAKPSFNGETITITGKYLKDSRIKQTINSLSNILECNEISSNSKTCKLGKGQGIFTITAISPKLIDSDQDLESLQYNLEYKTSPTTTTTTSSTSSPSPSSSPSTSSPSTSGSQVPNSCTKISITLLNYFLFIFVSIYLLN